MVNIKRGAGARKVLPATSGRTGGAGVAGEGQAAGAVPEVQAPVVDLGAQLVQLLTTRLNEMEGRLRTDLQTQINEVRNLVVGVQGQAPIAPVGRVDAPRAGGTVDVAAGVGGGVPPVVPPTNWLKVLKQFGDLKPKVFTGESGGISTKNWKKDIRRKVL